MWHAKVPGSGPPPRDGVLETYVGQNLAMGWGITLVSGGQYKKNVRQKMAVEVKIKNRHVLGPDIRIYNIN